MLLTIGLRALANRRHSKSKGREGVRGKHMSGQGRGSELDASESFSTVVGDFAVSFGLLRMNPRTLRMCQRPD
jgi:hypothetical protein